MRGKWLGLCLKGLEGHQRWCCLYNGWAWCAFLPGVLLSFEFMTVAYLK